MSATADDETTNGNRNESRKTPRSQRGISRLEQHRQQQPEQQVDARAPTNAMYAVDR